MGGEGVDGEEVAGCGVVVAVDVVLEAGFGVGVVAVVFEWCCRPGVAGDVAVRVVGVGADDGTGSVALTV